MIPAEPEHSFRSRSWGREYKRCPTSRNWLKPTKQKVLWACVMCPTCILHHLQFDHIFIKLHVCHLISHFVKYTFSLVMVPALRLQTPFPNETALSKMLFDKMMIMKLLKINVVIRALHSSLFNKQVHQSYPLLSLPFLLPLSFLSYL